MTDRKVTLQLDDGSAPIELPVLEPTVGNPVIDIASLTRYGYFTYDPGFVSTAACESAITYIDGEAGVLLHRGYPIDQLAEQSDHLELCYLLLYGELPNQAQKDDFTRSIRGKAAVDPRLGKLFEGFPRSAHPMSMLTSAVAALAGYFHDQFDLDDPEFRDATTHHAIAKVPTLAAMAYRYFRGAPFVPSRDDLSYAENFLHMMFSEPGKTYTVSPVIARAMDRIFMLHADHEQNASTSTVRLAGSTQANPYAALAAGIAALWGPSHGGANEAVLNMLTEIGHESRIEEYVARAKDLDDPFRLMGFGHRVYKNYDPRARVMQQTCHEVLEELGTDDPLLKVAQRLEKIALEDDYFVSRQLYPNVDFYSGITLRAIGLPVELFTALFACGRTPGWIAHWNEMVSQPFKIGRPRQLYTGPTRRDFVPMSER